MIKLSWLQKFRLSQAFLAFVLTVIASILLTTFPLPDPVPFDVFLTGGELFRYNLIQLIFLISFISAAVFCGMAYQAKDVEG